MCKIPSPSEHQAMCDKHIRELDEKAERLDAVIKALERYKKTEEDYQQIHKQNGWEFPRTGRHNMAIVLLSVAQEKS